MTRRWLWIMIAVLCSLLAVATSASAECAWVLWVTHLAGETNWLPMDALESKQECEARYQKMFPIRQSAGGGVEGPGTFTMHTCLPDTVDPRGPKGSTR